MTKKPQNDLFELRRQAGIEQRALAEKLGITASTLSLIEAGRVTLELDRAGIIAETLGVSLNTVLVAYRESRRRWRERPVNPRMKLKVA
jgi:transcriptional regulator with XRE-family HTH domain